MVASLSAHGDCCIEVELEIIGRLDEVLQFFNILELGITVEEKGRVIGSSLVMVVQFF